MPQSPTPSTDVGSASSLSKYCKLLRLVAVLCTAGFVAHAQAVPFLDASNDFLPSYAGAKDADLDVFASQGFKLREYTFNLWPRSEGSLANTVVPDFAPDQGNARVTIAGKRTRFELVRSSRAVANAGIQALSSRNFLDAQGPLLNLKP